MADDSDRLTTGIAYSSLGHDSSGQSYFRYDWQIGEPGAGPCWSQPIPAVSTTDTSDTLPLRQSGKWCFCNTYLVKGGKY